MGRGRGSRSTRKLSKKQRDRTTHAARQSQPDGPPRTLHAAPSWERDDPGSTNQWRVDQFERSDHSLLVGSAYAKRQKKDKFCSMNKRATETTRDAAEHSEPMRNVHIRARPF